jgi:hypothetical protein
VIQSARNIIQHHWPVILLIIINMVIGLAVVHDYGQSWDEPGIQKYAGQALSAYGRLIRGEAPPDYESDHMYYGPAFGMLGELSVRRLDASCFGWLSAYYWHLVYFLCFQAAVISLYGLSSRWMGRWPAFGVALLFMTQPLLWGHAFINPKDIPFLAFFLMSIALGFAMVDKANAVHLHDGGLLQSTLSVKEFKNEWKISMTTKKVIALIIVILWAAVGVFLVFFDEVVNNLLASSVSAVYDAGGQGFWGSLFSRLAPNAAQVPVDSYISKAQSMASQWEGVLYILVGLVLAFILLRLIAPASYRSLVDCGIKPGIKSCINFLKKPYVCWAAIILGLTISVRVLGPYAGILVGLFAVWKMGKRSLLILVPYFSLALLISYITWPFLWRDPVGRFLESVQVMSRFVEPDIGAQGGSAPWFDLGKMLTIQLTETLLFLFLAGLVAALFRAKDRNYLEPLLLWVLWFLVPVIGTMVSGSTLYDNFRQLFFLLPPVFIVGGLALEELFSRFNKLWLNGIVIALLVLPGISACIQLHPYEYIYYNSFVGGVKGVFRQYELDYWATSYKEAAEYLNEVAPPDSRIGVVGTDLIFKPYARHDLKVTFFNGVDVGEGFNYVVISSRANNDLAVCPNAKVIKTIERDEAVLTAIKQISSPEDCVLSP